MISKDTKELAEKARNNKLQPHEFQVSMHQDLEKITWRQDIFALVLNKLFYCSSAWGNTSQQNIKNSNRYRTLQPESLAEPANLTILH